MAQDVRLMYPHRYNINTDGYELKVHDKLYFFTSEQWNDIHFMNKYNFGWTDPRVTYGEEEMTSPLYKAKIEEASVAIDKFFAGKKPTNPFEGYVTEFEYVGSRVTCNPAPSSTDEDILIYSEDSKTLIGNCIEQGFIGTGSYVGSEFVSLLQGTVNLIITDKKEFFDKFMLATHVCKSLNLLDKQDRITVFQAILYGKAYGKP